MAKARSRILGSLQGLIGVIIGLLASTVFSNIVSGFLQQSVIFTTAVIAAIVIQTYFVSQSYKRIEELAEGISTSVKYVEEINWDKNDVTLKGTVYDEVTQLVSGAREEILAVSYGQDTRLRMAEQQSESRARYLRAVEDRLSAHSGDDFTYTRLIQVNGDETVSLRDQVDPVLKEHCERVWNIEAESSRYKSSRSGNLHINVKTTKGQRLVSYLIMDKRYLVVEVDNMDIKGERYAAGMFIIEDRKGDIIADFRSYFIRVSEQYATSLTSF